MDQEELPKFGEGQKRMRSSQLTVSCVKVFNTIIIVQSEQMERGVRKERRGRHKTGTGPDFPRGRERERERERERGEREREREREREI